MKKRKEILNMHDKKVAVILSGCGVYDGAEINEVVLSLLALERCGLAWQCFAPDIEQHHVVNHVTGELVADRRNVLVESARIVRGKIKPLTDCDVSAFSALLVPGGFGVAKNLSDFAIKGAAVEIYKPFLDLCRAFKEQQKPAGYLCIAPALLGKIYGPGVTVTVGDDDETIAAIVAMGARHQKSQVGEIVVDETNKVVTTAAYMLASTMMEAKSGIDNLVKQLNEMMRKDTSS